MRTAITLSLFGALILSYPLYHALAGEPKVPTKSAVDAPRYQTSPPSTYLVAPNNTLAAEPWNAVAPPTCPTCPSMLPNAPSDEVIGTQYRIQCVVTECEEVGESQEKEKKETILSRCHIVTTESREASIQVGQQKTVFAGLKQISSPIPLSPAPQNSPPSFEATGAVPATYTTRGTFPAENDLVPILAKFQLGENLKVKVDELVEGKVLVDITIRDSRLDEENSQEIDLGFGATSKIPEIITTEKRVLRTTKLDKPIELILVVPSGDKKLKVCAALTVSKVQPPSESIEGTSPSPRY